VISAYFEDVTRQSHIEDEHIDVTALCDDDHYAGSEGKEIKLKNDEKNEKDNKPHTKRNSPSRSRSVSKNSKHNIIDDEISTDTTKRTRRSLKIVPNDNDQPSQENLENISQTTKLTDIISKPSPKLHLEIPQIPKVQHSITFMSIFSDFLHNFGDGMNIAIAYTASTNSKSVGTSMALMITLHEVIRAVSDLSILMTHGNFSLLEACKMQLMTASGAVLGCFVGTLPMWISMIMEVSGGNEPKAAWGEGMLEVISPLSLGCFLYLSMQLLASLNGGEASGHGHGHSHRHGHSHGGLELHQGNESKGGCKSATVTPLEELKNGFLLLFVDLCMVVFGILSTQVVGMFE
jgi:zinc transporter ZupT